MRQRMWPIKKISAVRQESQRKKESKMTYVVINLERKQQAPEIIKGFDYLIGTFSSGEEDCGY